MHWSKMNHTRTIERYNLSKKGLKTPTRAKLMDSFKSIAITKHNNNKNNKIKEIHWELDGIHL